MRDSGEVDLALNSTSAVTIVDKLLNLLEPYFLPRDITRTRMKQLECLAHNIPFIL